MGFSTSMTFFYLYPRFWGFMIQFDGSHIFQMGWFNYQLKMMMGVRVPFSNHFSIQKTTSLRLRDGDLSRLMVEFDTGCGGPVFELPGELERSREARLGYHEWTAKMVLHFVRCILEGQWKHNCHSHWPKLLNSPWNILTPNSWKSLEQPLWV